MKTASNPNRILSIDMSVSSTPPPKRPHSPRLASAAFPCLPCEPRRALCEHDPNAESHDQNKKFLHCATFHSISSARRSSGSGKYAVNRPANRQYGSHHLLEALSCRSASSACFSQSSAIFKSAALSLLFIRSAIRRQSSAKVRYVFASRIYSSACPRAQS